MWHKIAFFGSWAGERCYFLMNTTHFLVHCVQSHIWCNDLSFCSLFGSFRNKTRSSCIREWRWIPHLTASWWFSARANLNPTYLFFYMITWSVPLSFTPGAFLDTESSSAKRSQQIRSEQNSFSMRLVQSFQNVSNRLKWLEEARVTTQLWAIDPRFDTYLTMRDCKLSFAIPSCHGILIKHDGSSIAWNLPKSGIVDGSIHIPSITELKGTQNTGKDPEFDRLLLDHYLCGRRLNYSLSMLMRIGCHRRLESLRR